MNTYPDPAVLYPDIIAEGGLGSALRAVAAELGFSLPVTVSQPDPLRTAEVASAVPHRKPLLVDPWWVERRWSIRGCESFQDMALIEGDTQDLAEIAKVARAWHDGVAPADIRRAAPFVRLTGRFEVADHNPVLLAESEWQHLRVEAGAPRQPVHGRRTPDGCSPRRDYDGG